MSVLKTVGAKALLPMALAVGLPLWLGAGAASAQTAAATDPFCLRPAVPACIDDLTTYVSADKMMACQNAVGDFTSSMEKYQSCRGSLQDVPAGEEMVSSIKRFNCRLQGGSDC